MSGVYSVHPSVKLVQDWIAALKSKTGRDLEEWLTLIQENGPADEDGRRSWLKSERGMGTNTAAWMAARSVGKSQEDEDPEAYLRSAEAYVEAMFAAKRASLRPIYDRLLEIGLAIGPDAKACPCQTMVPLFRNHVFAQIKPATNTRIDMGYALRDTPVTGRLIDTGGFAKKDRITHRIPITSLEDIDDEVAHWTRIAYQMDA